MDVAASKISKKKLNFYKLLQRKFTYAFSVLLNNKHWYLNIIFAVVENLFNFIKT